MRTVTMDGDDYAIIVPFRRNWETAWNGQYNNFGFFQQRFPAISGDQISLLHMKKQSPTATPDPTPSLLAAFREFADESGELKLHLVSKLNKKLLPFYPMLVPLDKNGFLDTFQMKNQIDGSIVTGGSFLLNGKPVKMNQVKRLKTGDKLDVADTIGSEDYDVRWVWANGCIICWDSLFSCTTNYLVESDLIGGQVP